MLPNGTRVVSETVPGARSVSAGVWVGVGSRDEPADQAGVSHFLEHLLFKGTTERDGRRLAMAVDAVGGDLNAYTGKESTVFYLRFPGAAAQVGLDLLVEMLTCPLLSARDVSAEREIILEELAAAEDAPEDVAEQLVWEALFPGHPLGWDVIGSTATVEAMTRDAVVSFFERWYRPANLVVAAAGAIDHDALVDAVAALEKLGAGTLPDRPEPGSVILPRTVRRRRTEQAQLQVGWRGVGHHDETRFALDVLEQILGGGPSSRLFQVVREERSLAYSVYAATTEYSDAGGLTVAVGTQPARVAETLDVVSDIVADLVANGVTDEELSVAKGYLEGSYWLGLEDNASRMGRLGWAETSYGEVPASEEYLGRIAALDHDAVAAAARRVLDAPQALVAVGPLDEAVLQRPSRP